jgi:hypothetical protein
MNEFCATADLYCSTDHLRASIDVDRPGAVTTLAAAAVLGRDVWADVADVDLATTQPRR